MPSISKIRLTNVVYEEGNKRYNDEIFTFDGHNGAILLENGGGKTVLIQTALQAILPHADLADRKIKNTLLLENAPAHIAIEWIANDQPRRYVVTAVSLFTTKQGLDSLRYVYEYDGSDSNGIEGIPFVRDGREGKRTAERGEMMDYYSHMREKSFSARTFNTIKDYKLFLEEQYHIISSEWESIAKINSTEGGVEAFFDDCKSTNQLFDRLLIPTVENSIVGHDPLMFADMFEQQLANFKNYKKLKETLEENKRIEQQLEHYTGIYEKLHNRKLAYEQIKQRAKGTWNELFKGKQRYVSEQTITLEKVREWEERKQEYQVKAASFEIYAEELAFKQLEAAFKEAAVKKIELDERLKLRNIDYFSLKLAQLKLDRQEQADYLQQIQEELEKFEQTDEAQDYEEQLEAAKQALLGWFLQQLEMLEKDSQALKIQLQPIVDQGDKAEQKKKELAESEKEYRNILAKIAGVIDSRSKDIERLKQFLLANPDHERVKDELETWQTRTQFLDEEIIRLLQEEKQLVLEEKEANERKEDFRKQYSSAELEMNAINFELKAMRMAQAALIQKLSTLRTQWAALEDVYLSQESIEKRLVETIEQHAKERDSLLYRERAAYRFEDDYGKQKIFFGDAFLEDQLSLWKNQFDYLVSGVEYVQALEPAEKEQVLYYPLWPITLVTTNRAKPKVIEKLNHLADQLQFPVIVVTTEEALAIHEQAEWNHWVVPSHWGNNMDRDSFVYWKEQIGSFARETTIRRQQKEKEIKQWEDGLNAFIQFMDHFPYEKEAEQKEKISALKNRLHTLSAHIQQEEDNVNQLRNRMNQNKKMADQFREEKEGLERKIEKGFQYLQFEKEIEDESKKEREAVLRLNQVLQEAARVDRELAELHEDRDYLKDRIHQIEAEKRIMLEDDVYLSLKSLTPKYTSESKKRIQEKMMLLQLKIREITIAQGEWLAKKEAAAEAIKRLDAQITDLRNEHRTIDETRGFPKDGKQLLKTLWDQIIRLKEETEKAATEVQKKGSKQDKQRGKWEEKIEQYKLRFPTREVSLFDKSLEEIDEELRNENEKLTERKMYIDQELARIEKELKTIEEAKHGLELFEEGHHFNAPDIVPIPLNSEEALEFSYNRNQFVGLITDKLKGNKTLVDKEKVEVEQEQRKFREFCKNEITDIKLQKMAINGVETKQNYQDIIEFKKNMLLRIEKISQYANEHIRKSDEELQLFINAIHSHLKTLVEELKQIPKKTRVKVMDDWKQIFSFSIPDWEEETGKMRIRDYIEWILQQLESDRFFNEQGIQDDGKVRKEIEMWLQSKQLLQMVLNNEVMKVSCRKVTNDNQVTTRSYSWEQSNVWSGGEKWSKNMTLFLGILNYVAEKKKHIQSNMKRHRAVILDNPFGKASSEHVLSPVFFVAEQLGFQIIALTAHAEGKFLQDYFPIIYSCRLRASTDLNKKVMTKEKWLHYAYFQDHEPKTIERLGETEQMALFELD
ncbi:hypothetical protein ACQYAD_11460 [Neobacillus sp. SM06]|uniref:hypothetical protein n=1 Tax=Neobacillus sp. SM06 TaxID=3422492 RepID=UPI003D2A06CE